MSTLTIGEVARLAGCRTSALRYYESVGLLPAPSRVNGRRRYTPDILQRLAILRVGQQAGFSIAELRNLLSGFGESVRPPQRWRRLAQRKIQELDTLIATARGMQRLLREGLQCNCVRWEDCNLIVRRTQPSASSLSRAQRKKSTPMARNIQSPPGTHMSNPPSC
jgi:MerR family transcriptional regulator, redox-sensitive transcriptional activator SoxR